MSNITRYASDTVTFYFIILKTKNIIKVLNIQTDSINVSLWERECWAVFLFMSIILVVVQEPMEKKKRH